MSLLKLVFIDFVVFILCRRRLMGSPDAIFFLHFSFKVTILSGERLIVAAVFQAPVSSSPSSV